MPGVLYGGKIGMQGFLVMRRAALVAKHFVEGLLKRSLS